MTKYALPDLPYDYGALEPHISAKIMQLHHDKHHKTYVDGANQTLDALTDAREKNDFARIAALEHQLAFHVSGHVLHSIFWKNMSPNGGGKPSGEVLAAIDRDLGGMEKFQTDFNAAGARVFGSGWVFVTVGSSGRLAIETRPNQDNPIMDGKRMLLGNDVWEHAYYLRYQNRRADYLKVWWNTVNWKVVGERYAAARAGVLEI